MSNPEMNTAWQERAEKILKARQDAKKSEREIELEQTIEDLRTSIKWNAIRDIMRWVLILTYLLLVS